MLGAMAVDPIEVRKTILGMLYKAKASHLGSNMSAVEILLAMYASVDCEKIKNQTEDRSRILVSKGHCAAATYAALAHYGILPIEELKTYHQDGSLLAGHVSHSVFGVEHSTGALGHGVNVALGAALGLKRKGYKDSCALVLLGDGEIQEGSVWEAMMYANHQKTGNLVFLIDNNQISSIKHTSEVINMSPIKKRVEGFGLTAVEVDGHDVAAIKLNIKRALSKNENSTVIICNTTKGKDVPFAENEPIWHYRTLDESLYDLAMNYLEAKKS
jgi:transketolase